MVSAMMSSEDKAFISNIVSGNVPMDLDENGNIINEGFNQSSTISLEFINDKKLYKKI